MSFSELIFQSIFEGLLPAPLLFYSFQGGKEVSTLQDLFKIWAGITPTLMMRTHVASLYELAVYKAYLDGCKEQIERRKEDDDVGENRRA